MKFTLCLLVLIFIYVNFKNKEHFNQQIKEKKYIILYTIRKSGTHLLSDIISLMINPKVNIYDKSEMYSIIPHRPIRNNKFINKKPYKIFNQHIGDLNLEHKNISKLILTIRNPIDLCISRFYYNEKRNPNSNISIYDYIKKNLNNLIKECLEQINLSRNHNDNILIRFEDIVMKKKDTTLEVYNFIKDFLNLGKIDLEMILNKTSFDKVQKEENKNGYKVGKKQPFLFHRKGGVGQWNEELKQEEFDEILKLIPQKIKYFYSDILKN